MTSERNIARIRTALPQAWAALVVWVLIRFHIVLDDVDTDLLLLIVPAAGATVYDLARWLESHGFVRTARVLLGFSQQPTYTPE